MLHASVTLLHMPMHATGLLVRSCRTLWRTFQGCIHQAAASGTVPIQPELQQWGVLLHRLQLEVPRAFPGFINTCHELCIPCVPTIAHCF